MEVKEKVVTLLKALDGHYVTWNVVIDDNKLDDILGIPPKSVIEVTETSIVQGFRLVIHNYDVIDDDFDKEITLENKLVFLEKQWYLDIFAKKGMVNNAGERNLDYPDLPITPLRMMTRSKTAKVGSGGVPSGNCGKKFKNKKTMEQHRKRYH